MRMIKGVTKNVIEINEMNSEYFEKAIIILRDGCVPDEDEIKREARLTMGEPPFFLKEIKRRTQMKMAICTVLGALISALILGTLSWAAG